MIRAGREKQIEGTWEEILRRAPEFAGKRVRLTILPEENPRQLRQAAEKLVAEVKKLQPDPNRPPLGGTSKEFADEVAQKLRRQGIK